MVREYTCDTLKEIRSIISKIQKETGKKLFFRGQITDRPFIPSINRPFKDANEQTLYKTRHSIVENLIYQHFYTANENNQNIDYFQTIMSILQHYGLRSWFIDITTDIEVAIWFSKMKFHEEKVLLKKTPCHEKDCSFLDKPLDHCISILSATSYKLTENQFGWIYIIGLDTIEVDKYILDLKSNVDSLRIQRQYGMGFFDPTFGNINLSSFVIAKIKVSTKIDINPNMSMQYLFPSWEEDIIYKSLLSVPHILRKENLKDPMKICFNLIDIPIYTQKKGDILSVSPYIRELIGTYIHDDAFTILPTDCAIISKPISMKKIFPNNRYININDEKLKRMEKIKSCIVDKDLRKKLFSLWPTQHFIILYSAYEMTSSYINGNSTYPIVRATRFNLKNDLIELFIYNEDLKNTYEIQISDEKYPEIYSELIVELIDLSLDIEEKKLGVWDKGNSTYDLHWLYNEDTLAYLPIGKEFHHR